MILKAPQWQLPRWAEKGLVGLLILLMSPIIVAVAAVLGLIWLKRKAVGPRRHWTRWFAWYPVRVKSDRSGFGETRWLETVERRSWDFASDTYKRQVGSTWEPYSFAETDTTKEPRP
jgi:hypothetical protein